MASTEQEKEEIETPAKEPADAPKDDVALESAAPVAKEESDEPAAIAWLRERYLSLDRRLLGIFRVYFGLLLLLDVLRRMRVATFFFSNEGILPNHYALFAPLAKPYFTLLSAFSSPGEVRVFMSLAAIVYVLYIVGYRTRVMQVLALIAYTSLDARNIFIENGGCVVVSIVCAWTMFLPLGDRFSIDALRKTMRDRADYTAASLNDRNGLLPDLSPHVSLVALAIAIEIAGIYFFNFVHKSGETWKSGNAVHWVLWQNRIATHLAAWLRMHEPSWFSPFASRSALAIEALAPALVLLPVFQKQARLALFLLTTSLHLGIAAMMTLGPFSYVMIALNMLMIPPAALDWAAERLRRGKVARTIIYDPTDAGVHVVARLLARLDAFDLLTFIDSSDETARPEGAPKATIATREPSGKYQVGTAAIVAASRSLPLGPVWALLLGNPLGTAALRALLRRRAHLTASLGLLRGHHPDEPGPAMESFAIVTPLSEQLGLTRVALRESFALVLLCAVVIELSHANYWLPAKLRFNQPKALAPLIEYPRLNQGWSMFSPDAPKQDGTLVVDGVTRDGRHLDPFTGAAPDFEAPLHGPWFQTQFWCDYFLKISFEGNRAYRDELKRYILTWQHIENRPPQDNLVSFEVYWVSNDAPPPGSTVPTNIQRKLLISSR